MQLEARMFLQPGLHLLRLVGGVQQENSPPDCFLIRFTVEDEMHVSRLEDSAVNAAQKAQEFLGAVAR